MDEEAPLRQVASHMLFSSPWMQLRTDVVEDRRGLRSEYGVVSRSDFVLVIPVADQDVLLVRQYRYPIGRWTLEFPQGALQPGETSHQAATRELREETGAEIRTLHFLGRFFEAAGFATHACEVFMGSVTRIAGETHDVTELGMSVVRLPIAKMKQLIGDGKVGDASSLAAWSLAREQGFLPL